MSPIDLPAPRVACRPVLRWRGWSNALLPRPYMFVDGDGTNARVDVGVNFGTEHGDPLVECGVDLVVSPDWFWLLDLLLRLAGHDV